MKKHLLSLILLGTCASGFASAAPTDSAAIATRLRAIASMPAELLRLADQISALSVSSYNPRTHKVVPIDATIVGQEEERFTALQAHLGALASAASTAEARLAAMYVKFDALLADSLSAIDNPALNMIKPARKAAVMVALGFDDPAATDTIHALITAIGGNIVTKSHTNADQAAMDAPTFLQALKDGGFDFDEDLTFAALKTAHPTHLAEIDAVELLVRFLPDFC